MSTNKIKLVVAYDGTDFRGWAAQAGLRTVQSTLKDAVRQISGEDCEITGASRTDGGAHALGQVCHFRTGSGMPPGRWATALNRILPADLRIRSSVQVPARFNSRFCADRRRYQYRILEGSTDPMANRYAFDQWRTLDLAPMQAAAKQIVGAHDFRAFSEQMAMEANTRRELFELSVSRYRNHEIRIDLVGTAFIRGMARRISGFLYEVGRARRPIEDAQWLLSPDRWSERLWPVVLPAKGLTLIKVTYGRHLKDHRKYGIEDDEE